MPAAFLMSLVVMLGVLAGSGTGLLVTGVVGAALRVPAATFHFGAGVALLLLGVLHAFVIGFAARSRLFADLHLAPDYGDSAFAVVALISAVVTVLAGAVVLAFDARESGDRTP